MCKSCMPITAAATTSSDFMFMSFSSFVCQSRGPQDTPCLDGIHYTKSSVKNVSNIILKIETHRFRDKPILHDATVVKTLEEK